MCKNAVNIYHFMLDCVPCCCKAQEMCEKAVSKEPFLLKYFLDKYSLKKYVIKLLMLVYHY